MDTLEDILHLIVMARHEGQKGRDHKWKWTKKSRTQALNLYKVILGADRTDSRGSRCDRGSRGSRCNRGSRDSKTSTFYSDTCHSNSVRNNLGVCSWI